MQAVIHWQCGDRRSGERVAAEERLLAASSNRVEALNGDLVPQAGVASQRFEANAA